MRAAPTTRRSGGGACSYCLGLGFLLLRVRVGVGVGAHPIPTPTNPYQVLFYCSFIRAEHAPLSDRGTLLESLRGKHTLEEWREWLA